MPPSSHQGVKYATYAGIVGEDVRHSIRLLQGGLPMRHSGKQTAFPSAQMPGPRQRGRRWLLLGGVAFALALVTLLGAATGSSQALAAGPSASQKPTLKPMAPAQCGGHVTVTAVRNKTITVTGPDGNTSTVYVNAQTHYTQYGHTASLSAVRVGSTIYVEGNCVGQGGRT